jgi:hypothetical protein
VEVIAGQRPPTGLRPQALGVRTAPWSVARATLGCSPSALSGAFCAVACLAPAITRRPMDAARLA